MRFGHTVRAATEHELQLCDGRFTLRDIFDPEEIETLSASARERIIGVFRHDRKTDRRQPRGHHNQEPQKPLAVRTIDEHVDSYISGVANKRGTLAYYILRRLRNPFITAQVLKTFPSLAWVLEIPESQRSRFAAEVQYKVLLFALNRLIDDGEVQYEARRGGLWVIDGSIVDKHVKQRDQARAASHTKPRVVTSRKLR